MTQEADRSPAQAGAAASRGAARQPAAAPGAGQPRAPGQPYTPGQHTPGQAHGAGQAHATGPSHGSGRSRAGGRAPRKPQGRPSLGGGTPAQDRELRAQGRETVRKLLEAGLIEFEERGFAGVRVDDVVQRAGISHGTFYLYFSNKEDLFKALLRDALHDLEIMAGDFPVVTSDETGLRVLRQWVRKFSAAYATHSTVLRTLSSANAPGEVFADGLRLFYSITEAITTGMTAAAEASGKHHEHAELTAFACLMMLERVNFVMTTEVELPENEMADRLADIMFAAFGLRAE
ncbi:MAG TPA: TetR/AcrR family transcriptional regulator [Trebonia sp.]